jgi:hypothetical protein
MILLARIPTFDRANYHQCDPQYRLTGPANHRRSSSDGSNEPILIALIESSGRFDGKVDIMRTLSAVGFVDPLGSSRDINRYGRGAWCPSDFGQQVTEMERINWTD